MTKQTKARRPEAADALKVIELIASESISLREACRKFGLHAPSTSTMIGSNEALQAQYDMARSERGDFYGEEVRRIGLETLKGDHDPKAARVAIDALKWTAGRMAPKLWGDKLEVDAKHSGEVGLIVNIKRFTPEPDAA